MKLHLKYHAYIHGATDYIGLPSERHSLILSFLYIGHVAAQGIGFSDFWGRKLALWNTIFEDIGSSYVASIAFATEVNGEGNPPLSPRL